MKTLYLRKSKKERAEIRKKYYQTDAGKTFYKYYKMSYFINLLLIGYGLYLLIDTILGDNSVGLYIYAISLTVLGLVFEFILIKAKNDKINRFLIKKDKK